MRMLTPTEFTAMIPVISVPDSLYETINDIFVQTAKDRVSKSGPIYIKIAADALYMQWTAMNDGPMTMVDFMRCLIQWMPDIVKKLDSFEWDVTYECGRQPGAVMQIFIRPKY